MVIIDTYFLRIIQYLRLFFYYWYFLDQFGLDSFHIGMVVENSFQDILNWTDGTFLVRKLQPVDLVINFPNKELDESLL